MAVGSGDGNGVEDRFGWIASFRIAIGVTTGVDVWVKLGLTVGVNKIVAVFGVG